MRAKLKALEQWFNEKFGWFFTNGNKQYRCDDYNRKK